MCKRDFTRLVVFKSNCVMSMGVILVGCVTHTLCIYDALTSVIWKVTVDVEYVSVGGGLVEVAPPQTSSGGSFANRVCDLASGCRS